MLQHESNNARREHFSNIRFLSNETSTILPASKFFVFILFAHSGQMSAFYATPARTDISASNKKYTNTIYEYLRTNSSHSAVQFMQRNASVVAVLADKVRRKI